MIDRDGRATKLKNGDILVFNTTKGTLKIFRETEKHQAYVLPEHPSRIESRLTCAKNERQVMEIVMIISTLIDFMFFQITSLEETNPYISVKERNEKHAMFVFKTIEL